MQRERPEIDPLWTAAELSHYLGVPVQTLYQWKWLGQGPPVHKIGRHLRYDPTEVRAWIAASPSKVA